MRNPAATYRELAVEGASPLELVVMLYDRAIVDLQRAIAAVEARDTEQRTIHLNHFFAVLAQLEGTLNHEAGGQVAGNLARFYRWARVRAFDAAMKSSKEILSQLSEHFATLRDAWREGERRLASEGPSSPANGRSARGDWGDTVALSVSD